MARGWESKSVESQQESAQTDGQQKSAGNGTGDKEKERERQSLLLSRAYLLHRIESSSNERYTESLWQALSDIDGKLAQLK
ncbi:MAG TPA: hypothetical protein VKW06_17960 [Candidatus Angelobacter sp.]|nr:hypothetical protein [Candidatus Angelobacter sp.]